MIVVYNDKIENLDYKASTYKDLDNMETYQECKSGMVTLLRISTDGNITDYHDDLTKEDLNIGLAFPVGDQVLLLGNSNGPGGGWQIKNNRFALIK